MKLAHLRDLSLCNDLGARLYQAAATYFVGRSHHCAVGLCFPRPRRLLFRGAGRYEKGGLVPTKF